MDALTKLEIDFARLRDRMYLERMAEIEKERIGIQLGELSGLALSGSRADAVLGRIPPRAHASVPSDRDKAHA